MIPLERPGTGTVIDIPATPHLYFFLLYVCLVLLDSHLAGTALRDGQEVCQERQDPAGRDG